MTWFGGKVCPLNSERAVGELALVLYQWGYTLGAPTPREPQEQAGLDERWEKLDDLASSPVQAYWGGWRALSSTTVGIGGQPVLTLGEHMTSRGHELNIALPVVSRSVMPGWVVLRQGDVRDTRPAYRLYANTSPEPLITAIPALAHLLAADVAGSSAKFLATYDHLDRADSTVIYLPEVPSGPLLERLVAILGPAVHRPATPLFTHQLADGIAFAQSPSDGNSFGMATCTMIAEQAIAALRQGRSLSPEGMTIPENPPIDPISAALDWWGRSAAPSLPEGGVPAARIACAALQACASMLGREALTAGGRATWLGPPGSTRGTLGADVYAGLAGPLLVLSHTVAITHDVASSKLLIAVARTMLARQPELPALGFHSGQPGTTAALAEAALVSQLPEVASLASASLETTLGSLAATNLDSTQDWDIIGGISGAAIALACVAAMTGQAIEQASESLVQALASLHEVDPRTGTVRWRLRSGRRSFTLAGLAHGGTGAALALVAAGRSEPRLLDLAQRSIQFEDTCCTDGLYWTDRRFRPVNPPASAWCHGAAGIGVGTAAILQFDLPRAWRSELDARIARAALLTSEATREGVADDGLCHGLSGRQLALSIMGWPRATIAQLGGGARFSHESNDLTLMTGEPGRVVAALVLSGLAQPPVALSLSPVSASRAFQA